MSRFALPAVILFAVLLRIAAWLVLSPEIESDGLAYVTMAQALITDGVLRDNFGQHVFYSAGYPLLLAPAFAVAGESATPVVVMVNCLLAAITCLVLHRLVLALSGSQWAALAAPALYALWLPAIWNAAMPAKENLSTPLLLGLLLAALAIGRGAKGPLPALAAGLCWGAGVITGGSALLAGLAVVAALGLLLHAGERKLVLRSAFIVAGGMLLTLGSWLVASDCMVGEPMLSTNAEFNLYLGNNPAATGRFVSIADTPAGPQWEGQRQELGEAGAAHWLGDMARDWITANPGAAARLGLVKLGLFWIPNVPDTADFAANKAVASVRLADVALYSLVLLAAAISLWRAPLDPRDRIIVAALIAGFWLVHAAAYVMPRYRDPLAPVLIALAICWASPLIARFTAKRLAHAA